jgi:septum formation protein
MADSCLFVLASGSSRRRELLELLGLTFTVIKPDTPLPNGALLPVDETPLPGELPPNLVHRLSRVKAQAVAALLAAPAQSNMLPDHAPNRRVIIIAADTVVVLDRRILGKPATPAEAVRMLQELRRTHVHQVYSGITVAVLQGKALLPITRVHRSDVWMRPYTNPEIEAYVAGGDPLDKAGAYAIQHPAFAPVARFEGCFAGIMGLPLGELAAALAQLDVTLPEIGPLCRRYSGQPCCQAQD